jgi:programmed cell death 6-interacting protein
MSLDATEDAIVGTLKQSLRQLENLGAQRASLEDMLKDMKRKDDILPKLMTITGSYEDKFRREISKYDHICEDISQNIEVQEQLLMQIQAQNEEFSRLFNLEDYKASREKCYKQIQAAIIKYREIKENINEGLKFYVTLQDAITNVKQQCSDFVMTRSIQCREMIEDVQRQMSGLSFQDHRSSGPYPSVHQQRASSSPPPPPETQNQSHPHQQAPYYRPPEQHSRPGYTVPPYGPPPPYHTPHGQAPQPYPPQSPQQPHPSWQQGSYYDPQGQQPRPPYTTQNPYPPPHQGGGYYRQ